MPPKKFTTLRAYATTGKLKLPGPQMKAFLNQAIWKHDAHTPKMPWHDGHPTGFGRKMDTFDDAQGLMMVLELVNNIVDPTEWIITAKPGDISVEYDDDLKLLQVLYKKTELLFAVQCTDKGAHLLNPGRPFAREAFDLDHGNKRDVLDGGGGFNFGMKDAAKVGVEHGFELHYECVGHDLDDPQSQFHAGLGANKMHWDRRNRMCVWTSSKGKDKFSLNSSLPLIETVLEIDLDAFKSELYDEEPTEDGLRQNWHEEREAWMQRRVEWLHGLVHKALCAFEFMYDLDLETPSTEASPLLGDADLTGYRSYGYLVHRNRYKPRIENLWGGLAVQVPEGMQAVLKLRMYDLTSEKHMSCNTLASHCPNSILRLAGKGFSTIRVDADGREQVRYPEFLMFTSKEREISSHYAEHHCKRILEWEVTKGKQLEVIGGQLLPMLRGGKASLLGDCEGPVFDLLAKSGHRTIKAVKKCIATAAVRAKLAAHGLEGEPDAEALKTLVENDPVFYRSDKLIDDFDKAQYYAHLLDTCSIQASVDDAHSKLFSPSSLNLEATEKRVAAKVKALADADEDKYKPPDELCNVGKYLYGENCRVYYAPQPEGVLLPHDFRDQDAIIIHRCEDITVAMEHLMKFGRTKQEMGRALQFQRALSAGKSERWKRPISDEARALVDGLPTDPPNGETSGYTSADDKKKKKPAPGDDKRKGKRKRPDSDDDDDSVIEVETGGGSTSTSTSTCPPIDPSKIEGNSHPLVTGGWKTFKPCHVCSDHEPLTYTKQEPFEVQEGVTVLLPTERPDYKKQKSKLFDCHAEYEKAVDLVREALGPKEWNGRDGTCKTVASYAPLANWLGFWTKEVTETDEKNAYINIGKGKDIFDLAKTICHELAHHNTWGTESIAHGKRHGQETARLMVLVMRHLGTPAHLRKKPRA